MSENGSYRDYSYRVVGKVEKKGKIRRKEGKLGDHIFGVVCALA